MNAKGEGSHIGMILKDLRRQRGWDQAALAAASGVSQAQISAIERRRYDSPRATTLAKLAAALGVSISAFFPEEGVSSAGVRERLAYWSEKGPLTPEEEELLELLRDPEMGKEVRRQMRLLKLAQEGRRAQGKGKKSN